MTLENTLLGEHPGLVEKIEKVLRSLAYDTVILISVALAGCQLNGQPRIRAGTLPTPSGKFSNPDNLGKHSYFFDPFESDGIVYTCRAGHIDLSHLRANADDTRYLTNLVKETLIKSRKGFSFNPPMEISKHFVEFTYPKYWTELPQEEKDALAEEISFQAGPYLAYNSNTWHEICTWFGTHYVGIEPEFNSAFSWEDMYSNILGVGLGLLAIRDKNHSYDEAMTIYTKKILDELGIQPKKTARLAAEKMRGKWFTGHIFINVIRRNMDIGLDGSVSPVLVPGICDCDAFPLPVPTLEVLSEFDFSMKYYIEPRVWEKGKILGVVYKDGKGKVIEPAVHYPILMDFIRKQAVEKYHYDIGCD